MILEQEIKRLLIELGSHEIAKIDLGGSDVTVQTMNKGAKLFLSTPIYSGGNYIPKSVRECLNKSAPFESLYLKTTLQVDEKNFRIYLNYTGDMDGIDRKRIVDVLEDFSGLAEKWREYLDKHDQDDLVRIPVR